MSGYGYAAHPLNSKAVRRDKREAKVIVYMPPEYKLVIGQLAKREDRTSSNWLLRVIEKEPSMQIALQQIGAAGKNN